MRPPMKPESNKPHRQKVCLAITKGIWGGAQEYVFTLATGLPSDKYDVFVICGEGRALPDKLSEKNIRVIKLDTLRRDISIKNEWRNFLTLFRLIKQEKPDVLHLNSPKAGGMGAVIGRLLGIKKIIYTAHGWSFNENRAPIQKFLIMAFSWLTVMLCHKVIVIAEREKKQAQKMLFVSNNKIILIRNGINKIDFLDRETARKELISKAVFCNPDMTDLQRAVLDDSVWIGTIAELHKNKSLGYALLAVAKIKSPVVYFILGEGEEREYLQKIIDQNMLQNKVFLVGFMPNASKYLSAFDIFILPSIKEGLPYVLLEAGAAGIPIVASRVGGIPDIIENNHSGILTTPKDIGEIFRAVDYLMNNPDTAKTFGQNLKQKVEREFSASEMVENSIIIYE